MENINRAIKIAPVLPVVVRKALELLASDEYELTLLRKTLESDPVIAGRVLSVANSSFYGMEGQVGNLNEAFMVLGTCAIRNIILAAGAVGAFPPKTGISLDLTGLWQHSIGTAVTAKILAGHIGEDAETALMAGLLHAIGKMFLDACFTKDYLRVMEHRDSKDCLLVESEMAILGIDHGSVGALLAKYWHLPETIIGAIKSYSKPELDNKNPLVDLVHVANIICCGLEIGDAGDSQIAPLSQSALIRLDLDLDSIKKHFVCIEEMTAVSVALLK